MLGGDVGSFTQIGLEVEQFKRLPHAEGKPSPHEELLHNAAPHAGAIRVGDWKLVINGSFGTSDERPDRRKAQGKRRHGETVELFNIAQDPYEKDNLTGTMPGKVRELRARYDVLAAQAMPPSARESWYCRQSVIVFPPSDNRI